MSTPQPSSVPKLTQSIPLIWIRDLKSAETYYQDKLGFESNYEFHWEKDGREMGLVGMMRDEIHLQVLTCNCDDRRHDGQGYFIACVEGIDELYKEMQARGADIWEELEPCDWGGQVFTIEDPDGNRIEFMQLQ